MTMQEHNKTTNQDISEQFPQLGHTLSKLCARIFTRKLLFKRLPILQWLPSYSLEYFVDDVVAGLSVGLTVIPQGIAYAVIANIEPQYGLYSAFMGCFMYCIFGSCKDVTIGPTAIMSLMVQAHIGRLGVEFAILISFITGCVILLLGMLNLGILVQFISLPVTVGFTSAAAITIASGQLKSLLGIPGQSNDFLDCWINAFEHLSDIKLYDSILGVSTIVILLILMQMKNLQGGKCWKLFGKYVALSRNAIVVILSTLLAYSLSDADFSNPFLLIGNVTSGFPSFQPPPFTTTINGSTYTFLEMIHELGTSVIILPLIGILESISIAKAFANGKSVDATQEMIALGICNIAGSFVLSMPVAGSFTRSAVNSNSGVQTQFGGVITGAIVLLALGLLTKTLFFIPKATLAGVIIAAMFYMIEFQVTVEIWRTKRIEILPMMITLIASLFLGLEYGMLVGIGVSICFILCQTSRPLITSTKLIIESNVLLLIQVDQSLIYSSAEFFKYQILKIAANQDPAIVVIDGSYIKSIDTTVAKVFVSMTQDLEHLNRIVVYWKWNRSARCTLLRMSRQFFEKNFYNELYIDIIVRDILFKRRASGNIDVCME